MKKVWFVTHATTIPKYAARMRTNNLAKYLAQRGYDVEIFSASTVHNTDINLIEDRNKLFIENNFDGVIYNSIRTSNYSGNGLDRIINMIQFPMRLFRVSKVKKEKPDVIICNPQSIFAIIPYLISKKYNAKFISEVRDLWPESIVAYKGMSKKNPIIWMMYQFEKWIYKRADKIIFTMEGGKDYIIDKGWDINQGGSIDLKKVYHINNGVDLEQFNYNRDHTIIEDEDLHDNIFKIVYTGSIRTANNVRKIVDTAAILKEKRYEDIKFLIYGDGPDKEILEKFCKNNNINNISFKGHVDKNKIPYILSKCDLNIMHFTQSNLKKYGASLNKMFEYLASGKPTISDCEFGYDLIKKYNCGLTIDNANAEELAKAILKFYRMPKEEYNAYCKNALKAAEDYDFKLLTEKLIEIIEN